MAARLLLRRVLVGNSEYGLPVESMDTLGGTQIQEAPETNWLQMPGHFATSVQKNWWEKPSTRKFLTFRWSMPIPSIKQSNNHCTLVANRSNINNDNSLRDRIHSLLQKKIFYKKILEDMESTGKIELTQG